MSALLALRFRILRNSVWPLRWGPALRAAALLALSLGFMWALHAGFMRVLRHLLRIPDFSPFFVMDFAERLLAMVCLFVFTMLFFSVLAACLGTQYLGRDLPFLMALPTPVTRVFHAKFRETALAASYAAVLFPLPVLTALGSTFYAGPTFYLAALPLLALFAVTPAALGALGTLLLMRVLPAEKISRLLSVLGLGLLVALVMAARFMRPEDFFDTEKTDEIRELLQQAALPAVPYLPSTWLARANLALVEGAWEEALLRALWLALAAALSLGLLALAARRFYFDAWSAATLTEHVTRRPKAMPGMGLFRRAFAPLHPHLRAMLWKDALLFFRDTAQWSQLMLLGGLVVVYLYNIASLPFPQPYLRNAIVFLNVGMGGFVLAAVAARFVYPAVSVEGRAAWVLYAAPMKMTRVLWSKCAAAFVPLFLLALALIHASNVLLEADGYMRALSVGMVFCMTLALTGLGVGMGAGLARYDAESPSQVAASGGAMLYMAASLVFVSAAMSLAARPVYFHFMRTSLGWEFGAGAALHYAAVAALSLAVCAGGLAWGARRLARFEV